MKFSKFAKAAVAILMAIGPVSAQAAAIPKPPSNPPPYVSMLNGSLDKVLASDKDLRSRRMLTARDLEAPLPAGYDSGMYNVFLEETGAAKLASETQGKKGDAQRWIYFEDLAVRHEKTLDRENGEYQSYMASLKDGRVLIDPKVVAGWPARDQQAFKAFLSPKAALAYPSLTKLSALPMAETMAMVELTAEECRAAAPCVVPCRNQNWAACLACINRATAAARTAWSQYQSCKGGAGKPRWVPLRVWQAGCLLKFIAVLA